MWSYLKREIDGSAPGLHQSSWEPDMSQKGFDYWLSLSHGWGRGCGGAWVKETQAALLWAAFRLYLDNYVYCWKNLHLGCFPRWPEDDNGQTSNLIEKLVDGEKKGWRLNLSILLPWKNLGFHFGSSLTVLIISFSGFLGQDLLWSRHEITDNFLSSAKQVNVATGITRTNISLLPQKIMGISLRREGHVPGSEIQTRSSHFNIWLSR